MSRRLGKPLRSKDEEMVGGRDMLCRGPFCQGNQPFEMSVPRVSRAKIRLSTMQAAAIPTG